MRITPSELRLILVIDILTVLGYVAIGALVATSEPLADDPSDI